MQNFIPKHQFLTLVPSENFNLIGEYRMYGLERYSATCNL